MLRNLIQEAKYTVKDLEKAYASQCKANSNLDACYSDDGTELVWGRAISGKKAATTRANKKVGEIISALYGDDMMTEVRIRAILQNGGKLPSPAEYAKEYGNA